MAFDLRGGFVDGCKRRAREFELAARLERDRCPAYGIIKPNEILAVIDRLPAEPFLHSLEKCADAGTAGASHAIIGHRRVWLGVKRKFLVRGADPELVRRLY